MGFKTIFQGKKGTGSSNANSQMSNSYLFRHGLPLHEENKEKPADNKNAPAGNFSKLGKKAEEVALSKDTLLRKAQVFLYKVTGWSAFLSGSAAALDGEPDVFLAAGAGSAMLAALTRFSEKLLNLLPWIRK